MSAIQQPHPVRYRRCLDILSAMGAGCQNTKSTEKIHPSVLFSLDGGVCYISFVQPVG